MRVGAVLGLLMLMVASAGAEVRQDPERIGSQEKDGTYKLAGEEVPIHFVVESFLLDAADFYSLDDVEAYQQFCEEFGIESAWPSASHLGTLINDVFDEYNARHGEALSDSAREQVGAVWKPRALGEGFGGLFDELRSDGLALSFDVFLKTIELQVRDRATRFSNEPFNRGQLRAGAVLFWQAAAKSSSEVAAAVGRGRNR